MTSRAAFRWTIRALFVWEPLPDAHRRAIKLGWPL